MINLSQSYESEFFIDEFPIEIEWFLELILAMSVYHQPLTKATTLYERQQIFQGINALGINMEIVSVIQFEVYVNVYTHLCARHPHLRYQMVQGIYVLYQYLLLSTDEAFVIEMLRYVLPPNAIHDRSDPAAFTDPEGRLYWNQSIQFCSHRDCDHSSCTVDDCRLCRVPAISCTVHNCSLLRDYPTHHTNRCRTNAYRPIPCRHRRYASTTTQYVIRVPWRMVLDCVKQRSHWTENGIVCLSWHDVPLLMKGLWDYKVRTWQEHDFHNFFVPMANRLGKTTTQLYAPYVNDWTLADWWNFYRVHCHAPVREKLAWRFYISPERPINRYYNLALEAWKKHKPAHSFASSSVEIVEYTPQSNDFKDNYLRLMPPCITNIIKYHLANKTHPKNNERHLLFRYFHAVKIPLKAATNVWNDIVEQATDASGKKRELKHIPAGVYSTCESKPIPFNGCHSMAEKHHACPFANIEDIRERKTHCGSVALWKERLNKPTPSPWPERGKGWSPVISYNALVTNLLKESS